MALLKAIPQPIGVDAEYWKLIESNLNWWTQAAHVVIGGWLDQQARLDLKQPLVTVAFDLSAQAQTDENGSVIAPAFSDVFGIDYLDIENVNPVAAAYVMIKAHPMFSGAEDC